MSKFQKLAFIAALTGAPLTGIAIANLMVAFSKCLGLLPFPAAADIRSPARELRDLVDCRRLRRYA